MMKVPKLRVLSRSSMPFRDRQEAGRLLAAEILELRGQQPVVLVSARRSGGGA